MVTTEELEVLYKKGKYREVIEAVPVEHLSSDPKDLDSSKRLLRKAWAYHQLGQYDNSTNIFAELAGHWEPDSEIGESSRRGLAHGILQKGGDIEKAENIANQLPGNLDRDNLLMNIYLVKVKKVLPVPWMDLLVMARQARERRMPYETAAGHLLNNIALALYNGRNLNVVKDNHWLETEAVMDITAAIGIYQVTGTPKNHLGSAFWRASQIFQANGWKKLAKVSIQKCRAIWVDLEAEQGGERYRQNRENAEKLEQEIDLMPD